ncbi:hypothetical protein ACFLSU_00690 [Bacteroidota bacterium]
MKIIYGRNETLTFVVVKKWRIILCLFLSSLMLYGSLRVSLTYMFYSIDTEGFIALFCENIDKPELECNGKCHLKKVTETSNENPSKTMQLVDFKDIVLYNECISSVNFTLPKLEQKQFFFYKNLYNYKISSSPFHPPKFYS